MLDLNVLVTDMERMLRRLIGEHIELVVTLAPGDSRVTADRGRMEQVIMNLVFNARDAMPGRRPPVAGHRARGRRRRRRRAWRRRGARAVRLARGTATRATGWTKQTQANLFEPFFTTKASTKGTGLGLSLVQAVVRELGGVLTVRSRVGEGSTFRILLPRVAPASDDEPSAPGAACGRCRAATKPCCSSTTRSACGSSCAIC